jgi:hypothetical protein
MAINFALDWTEVVANQHIFKTGTLTPFLYNIYFVNTFPTQGVISLLVMDTSNFILFFIVEFGFNC